MLVLHANWSQGALWLWAESLEAYASSARFADTDSAGVTTSSPAAVQRTGAIVADRTSIVTHPYIYDAQKLRDMLVGDVFNHVETGVLRVRLPHDDHGPWPSDQLARLAGDIETPVDPWLQETEIAAVRCPPDVALRALTALEGDGVPASIEVGASMRFWLAVGSFVLDLLADQRFVPTLSMLSHDWNGSNGGDRLQAAWSPWSQDEPSRRRISELLRSMPPSARAAVDRHQHQSAPILDEALRLLTDATVRAVLSQERFIEAVDDRDPATDPHVTWLTALLDQTDTVQVTGNGTGARPSEVAAAIVREATGWMARLDDRGADPSLHLLLHLHEPLRDRTPGESTNRAARASAKGTGVNEDQATQWPLVFHLEQTEGEDASDLFDAEHIWNHPADFDAAKVTHMQETLLAELGRASRVYPKIERALSQKHPTHLDLTTQEAHEFLRDVKPVLEEAGIETRVPDWWGQPQGRLGARLRIESPSDPVESAHAAAAGASQGTTPTTRALGLNTLVKFQWQVAIGDHVLSAEELKHLARQAQMSPLVRVNQQWIEINPEQLAKAQAFFAETQRSPAADAASIDQGEMTLLQAIHAAYGLESAGGKHSIGLPVIGIDAKGWVADFISGPRAGGSAIGTSAGKDANSSRQLSEGGSAVSVPMLDQPTAFQGVLRPYQKAGLSWLAFLDQFGFGAALADDMGLGKTIQLIALLLHERSAQVNAPSILPTLLIVPTSVVANWVRELQRFAPLLRVHVQHGQDRPLGEGFAAIAASHDVVITTYPLVSRDIETLRRMNWHRVALDEAQYIKNTPTKQTTAIRSLKSNRRVALTGTPVENRLSELWSIMEFCNPGYLGHSGEFRRLFGIPIERHRNRVQQDRLRELVRPFILRRVKTDPKVIDDLPDCTQTREYATLTVEQAALYQRAVNEMLGHVDAAKGIQRRGLVLATLVKLKQICNHPAQVSTGSDVQSDDGEETERSTGNLHVPALGSLSSRSGKSKRLMVMLEEVIASGEKALIFTQFRKMGHLLTAMIQNDLDREAIFLHGGTPAAKRQEMIDRFQSTSVENGGVPVFVLSLKAGGLGLNLTAANHVFHYDRWWNPAVENQATDRAFRIGQMKAVHVHKFVCIGTLEERIDEMIEQKIDLATNIIGTGEQWLTELTTNQLHDLLMLRPSAIVGGEEGES